MDKNIDFSNQMELEHILGDIDLNEDAPVEEPARQYYFIAKARKYITEIRQTTFLSCRNLWLSDECQGL